MLSRLIGGVRASLNSLTPPQEPPEQVFSNALQLIQNQNFKDFNLKKPAIFQAFLIFAKMKPHTALKALLEIERIRPTKSCPDFFHDATPHIKAILSSVPRMKKKDLYCTILEAPAKGVMADFLLDQADDIIPLMHGDFGARIAKRIIEHSAPKNLKILQKYEVAFAQVFKTSHKEIYLAKLLCQIYKKLPHPLPDYLDKIRGSMVTEQVALISSAKHKDIPDYNKISLCLRDIAGLGIGSTDSISKTREGEITLFKIKIPHFGGSPPRDLFIAAKKKRLGSEDINFEILLVGNDLSTFVTSLSNIGRPKTEIESITKMLSGDNLCTPKDSGYKNIRYTGIMPSILTPAFRMLTVPISGVNSCNDPKSNIHTFTPSNWNLLPFELHQPRAT